MRLPLLMFGLCAICGGAANSLAVGNDHLMQVSADLDSSSIRIKFSDPAVQQRLQKLQKTSVSQGLNRSLRVVVSESENIPKDQPSVSGEFEFDKDGVIFHPKYPLTAGVRYWVVVSSDSSAQSSHKASVKIEPQKKVPSTRVTAIYPSTDRLPENLLKFYVYFSAPMSFGKAYTHINLVEENGQPLRQPFLEIAEELWDPSGTRLTMLLDPARVKRGLVPREEDGPVLNTGKRYKLIISSAWEDSQSTPLVAEAIKVFTVVGNDFTSPNPSTWKITSPESNTREAVTVDVREPLDHAIVTRSMIVLDVQGKRVDGTVSLHERETIWKFQPAQPWLSQPYTLQIADIIEDLAGNNIARPFEVDRFDRVEAPVTKQLQRVFQPTSRN